MNDQRDDGINRQTHNSTNGKASKPLDHLEARGGRDLLDAGLRYIKRGWPILAVDSKKEPLKDFFPHGFKSAQIGETIIRAVAAKYPGAGWALAIEEGLVIADLDVKHGDNGIRDFERLHGCHPEEFPAPRVRTATGGYHIYMDPTGRKFQNTVGRIAPGIDTRAAGLGYAVLPSGGNGYFWETSPDTLRPPAPAWMEAALQHEHNCPIAEVRQFQGENPVWL
jgi:hypothetical protein